MYNRISILLEMLTLQTSPLLSRACYFSNERPNAWALQWQVPVVGRPQTPSVTTERRSPGKAKTKWGWTTVNKNATDSFAKSCIQLSRVSALYVESIWRGEVGIIYGLLSHRQQRYESAENVSFHWSRCWIHPESGLWLLEPTSSLLRTFANLECTWNVTETPSSQ